MIYKTKLLLGLVYSVYYYYNISELRIFSNIASYYYDDYYIYYPITYSLCGMSSAWARTPGIGDMTTATSNTKICAVATTGQQEHVPLAKNMAI